MQQVFSFLLRVLQKISRKKIVYFPRSKDMLGKTAVKADAGFWYVGDMTNTADIAYGLLYNGSIEPEETKLVEAILKILRSVSAQLVFYDIGANTGYYGILAASVGKGNTQVYSFEPLREYQECLRQTVVLNRLEPVVQVFPVALSDVEGEATLHVAGSGSTLNKSFLGNGHSPEIRVPVKRLDGIIAREHLRPPGFIKIDVEGHELAVLRGARENLEQYHPVLFIEIAQTLKSLKRDFINPQYKETLVALKSWGYNIFCLDGKQLMPVTESFAVDGVKMYLCVHSVQRDLFASVVAEYSQTR